MLSEFVFFQLFINNEFVDSVSGKTFPVINPTNGEKICDVQEGNVNFDPGKICKYCDEFLPRSPEGLSGYCFHPWCPDGRAGVRAGGRKKFVQAVYQKP